MNSVIIGVTPGSRASKTSIRHGDVLRKINGQAIHDVIDYKYHSYGKRLLLELGGADGRIKLVRLSKPEGADIGLEFDSFLMDRQRSCANNCIFCFIDQLPKGMRDTLYYKDDDVRLSFLQGNYVTLTNVGEREAQRIISMRLSPINVSVHSLTPSIRSYMLGTGQAERGLRTLKKLTEAGISVNCQIVCCPGINDGEELSRTMEGLTKLKNVVSVSVVPVGLTAHREGLRAIEPFSAEAALKTVHQVEAFGEICKRERGARMFYCADELYIKSGVPFPRHEFYEEYPQLENGVGMMRLFIAQFMRALRRTVHRSASNSGHESARCVRCPGALGSGGGGRFTVATGVAAGPYIKKLLMTARQIHGTMDGRVIVVRNGFFGDGVTVSGLLTGGDVISELRGADLGSRLLIPQNMLRRGSEMLLDDISVTELSEALHVPVRIVEQDGADLLRAFLGD